MSELLATFTLGLLSSAHCVGMCGGFAAAIGATKVPLWPRLSRQLVYSVGRISTYAFLGALAGYSSLSLSNYSDTLVGVQQGFSIVAGVMMLAIGASVLGLLRFRFLRAVGLSELFAPIFRHFLNARGLGDVFVAGLANGFLPCGLVYAFVAKAASTADVGAGASIMIAFGLGTVPAMVAVGCGSILISQRLRRHVYKVAAVLVMMAGAITLYRGVPMRDPNCCADLTTTAQLPLAPASSR